MQLEPEHSLTRRLFVWSLPISPAWVFGAFVLLTSPKVWEVIPSPGLATGSPDHPAAWILMGNVVFGSVLYAFAPRWGPLLPTVSSSYSGAGLRPSSGIAADFGTVVLRGLALVMLYLVTFAIWKE